MRPKEKRCNFSKISKPYRYLKNSESHLNTLKPIDFKKMPKNVYLLEQIGADAAENEHNCHEIL